MAFPQVIGLTTHMVELVCVGSNAGLANELRTDADRTCQQRAKLRAGTALLFTRLLPSTPCFLLFSRALSPSSLCSLSTHARLPLPWCSRLPREPSFISSWVLRDIANLFVWTISSRCFRGPTVFSAAGYGLRTIPHVLGYVVRYHCLLSHLVAISAKQVA